MTSHIEKISAGLPRGFTFSILNERHSFERGRWIATPAVTIIGRVRVVQGDRIVVLDERTWNRRGNLPDTLDTYGVIMDSADPGRTTVHPVDVDIETGEIRLPLGGDFGRRWMYESGLVQSHFGLPYHPIRVLDVFDRETTKYAVIEVPA